MLSSFRLIGLVARLVSPGPGLGWQQGGPSPPLPVVYEALPMVHKMEMDIQDISYFECFKCHQQCLQTNSIILGMIQKLRNPFLRHFSLGTPLFHCIIFWLTMVLQRLCNS